MKSIQDKLRHMGLLAESNTFADLCANPIREQLKGFCVNDKCRIKKRTYVIKGFNKPVAVVTTNKDIFSCRECGYAIFWSSRYKKIRAKNDPHSTANSTTTEPSS